MKSKSLDFTLLMIAELLDSLRLKYISLKASSLSAYSCKLHYPTAYTQRRTYLLFPLINLAQCSKDFGSDEGSSAAHSTLG